MKATSKRLIVATRNVGKVAEFRRILDAISEGAVELVGIDQFPELDDVAETGATFEENALLKARYTAKMTGLPSISDDSGLCVDALGGRPGYFLRAGQVSMEMTERTFVKFSLI